MTLDSVDRSSFQLSKNRPNLWAWLYERTGHLAGPWISHALADAALMWVGYQMWRE